MCVQRVVCRFHNANLPRQTLAVDALCNHLSTNLHHEVLDAFLAQETRYDIAAITLGNGSKVERAPICPRSSYLILRIMNNFHLVETDEA